MSASTLVAADAPATVKPASSYTLPKRPWRPYVEPFERLVSHRYAGAGTDADPYVVDWLPADAENPMAFPAHFKWAEVALASFATLAVAASSSAYAGAIESYEQDFGGSAVLWTAGVSLFVVGFAFGPLLWAPASEVWGRRAVYIVTYAFLTLWQAVAVASPSAAAVLVFRALAGFFGSSPLAVAGGTIFDMLDANQRGLGMAVFMASSFFGTVLGPITGGFIGDAGGWRWVEAFLALWCGLITLLLAVFSAETYAPRILRHRAARLSAATGKVYRYRPDAKQPFVATQLFTAALTRPWKFLFLEPIVLLLSIYVAIIYGTLYMFFAAFPIVFAEQRGWNAGLDGLAFLGVLVGVVLSVVIAATWINPGYIKTVKQRGHAVPEDRLPPTFWASVLIVVGLAGFAATDGSNVHWIAPIIFGAPFGLGMVSLFLAILGYLVDVYTVYAASVLAANSVLRSLFGAAFPLFTDQMYRNLGVHWAAALPGFLALACLPFPFIFYRYGAAIRARCKYAADAQRTMAALVAAKNKAEAAAAARRDEEKAIEGGGGPGAAGADATLTAAADDAALHPSEPRHPLHDEWQEYAILADRDEVDLSDDARVRLASLHERFGHEKAKKSA